MCKSVCVCVCVGVGVITEVGGVVALNSTTIALIWMLLAKWMHGWLLACSLAILKSWTATTNCIPNECIAESARSEGVGYLHYNSLFCVVQDDCKIFFLRDLFLLLLSVSAICWTVVIFLMIVSERVLIFLDLFIFCSLLQIAIGCYFFNLRYVSLGLIFINHFLTQFEFIYFKLHTSTVRNIHRNSLCKWQNDLSRLFGYCHATRKSITRS